MKLILAILVIILIIITGHDFYQTQMQRLLISHAYYKVLTFADDNACIINKAIFLDTVYLSFSYNESHWGGVDNFGRPFVAITLSYPKRGHRGTIYAEYDHIKEDPEIGEFILKSKSEHWQATIAHEIAHAILFWNQAQIILNGEIDQTWSFNCLPMLYDEKDHGYAWQRIYRNLRKKMQLIDR